ncbi:MAG: dTDP-4-dehydrorhamnose 3,5-epimerase [Acidobacteria bacterium RIFCSPLOWO2_12_FULL_54_10]|nr:MAG: dTDP-4-dehydrorhamnose 3,5-epimerase [Acidobacteria bacterium RIFCSPLOWO2_12_FULL_54_10]
MMQGVTIHALRQILDDRGKVMHMLRADDPHFEKFGEIYFSTAYPGVVKAWHLHSRMTINYAVIVGVIKLVVYDDRPDSPTKGRFEEICMGEGNYVLAQVSPGLWNGWKCIGTKPAIVANCATIPHDPAEMTRMDPHNGSIVYDWNVRDR